MGNGIRGFQGEFFFALLTDGFPVSGSLLDMSQSRQTGKGWAEDLNIDVHMRAYNFAKLLILLTATQTLGAGIHCAP